MSLCHPCRNGHHPHDRWTEQGKPGHGGEDAGCPNLVDGRPCECDVVLPRRPVGGRHCPTCRCAS